MTVGDRSDLILLYRGLYNLMHWIIQADLHREEGHAKLLSCLERHEIPFTEVKVIPFTSGLPLEQRFACEIDINSISNPVMVCGSTSLSDIAHQANWVPGSFHNENHRFEKWLEHYQDNVLNFDAVVDTFKNIDPQTDEFFIRPCEDSKTFSGVVYRSREEFDDWRQRVIDLNETYTSLDANTVVMCCNVKNIFREVRFFVVDGQVVTGSTYKLGNKVLYTEEIPPELQEFAERMVAIWQPSRAFVLDVALTDLGPKVVEINCINSSGFYAIDVPKFVYAIESMRF